MVYRHADPSDEAMHEKLHQDFLNVLKFPVGSSIQSLFIELYFFNEHVLILLKALLFSPLSQRQCDRLLSFGICQLFQIVIFSFRAIQQ
jgi:hypothetical protein